MKHQRWQAVICHWQLFRWQLFCSWKWTPSSQSSPFDRLHNSACTPPLRFKSLAVKGGNKSQRFRQIFLTTLRADKFSSWNVADWPRVTKALMKLSHRSLPIRLWWNRFWSLTTPSFSTTRYSWGAELRKWCSLSRDRGSVKTLL